jgi:ketosteroid isomerase-like protein
MQTHRRGSVLVFLLSVILLSCVQKQENQTREHQQQSAAADSDLSEVRASIAQISQKMEQAVLANDMETQLSFLADSIIIDPPLEPPLRGKTAVEESMARASKEGMKYRSFSGTTEDLWVSGNKVYERGTWGASITTHTTKQPFAAYGSFFEMWTKDNAGSYRIQYLIYTLDMNPYETGR